MSARRKTGSADGAVFRAGSGEEARQRLEAVAQLERPLPKIAARLEEAEEDILSFSEIGRRTDVFGIFPDDASHPVGLDACDRGQ